MKRTLLLAASAAVLAAPTIAQELPPGNPLPGECFARVIVPAQYETSTEQVVLRQAGEEIKKIPGRFETVTERVLVQEASYEIVPVGAGGSGGGGTVRWGGNTYRLGADLSVYDSRGQLVGVLDSSGNVVGNASTAAAGGAGSGAIVARGVSVSYNNSGSSRGALNSTFRTVSETVVVQEASTELVAVPATYDTVTETVVVQPASFEYVAVPAVYENYTDTVVVQEASTELVTIPPVFETVTDTVVVQEASTELVTIPATYETVSETVVCLLYTSPSPRDRQKSRMPSSA